MALAFNNKSLWMLVRVSVFSTFYQYSCDTETMAFSDFFLHLLMIWLKNRSRSFFGSSISYKKIFDTIYNAIHDCWFNNNIALKISEASIKWQDTSRYTSVSSDFLWGLSFLGYQRATSHPPRFCPVIEPVSGHLTRESVSIHFFPPDLLLVKRAWIFLSFSIIVS